MHSDSRRLVSAVAKAIGGRIDPGDLEDRLTMQQGCYILNAWGYGPRYRYDLYIRGPYSRDLAEDLRRSSDDAFGDTDVPEEAIARLRGIFDRGAGYVEAYATVLLIIDNSPGASADGMRRRALGLKPHLEKEVREACESLLT